MSKLGIISIKDGRLINPSLVEIAKMTILRVFSTLILEQDEIMF